MRAVFIRLLVMGHVLPESSPTLLADKVHVVGLLESMIFFLSVAFGAL
jgi:hypothetical protein